MSEPSSSPPGSPEGPGQQLVGTTIAGRYKVESLLGTGGMGSVYLVQHTHMRKRFALKILNSQTAQNPEMVARFEREAMAAAHVEHPNVTVAIDFGKAEDGTFFLVLEYLEGQRLRDAMDTGPLAVGRAMHISRQIASALERSHELGIIHRDLKPENIMLVSRQGDPDFVKVLDFGLAKVATGLTAAGGDPRAQALTKKGAIFGTPVYMAPEQCVAGTIDGRTDLYALGLIMYEMLTGVQAFSGRDNLRVIMQQLTTPTPAMETLAPGVRVPGALQAVVMRLTEKPPERRYENATAVLVALAEVAEQEGILPPEPVGTGAAAARRALPGKKESGVAQAVNSVDIVSENAAAATAATVQVSEAQLELPRAAPVAGQGASRPPILAAPTPSAPKPAEPAAKLPAAQQNNPQSQAAQAPQQGLGRPAPPARLARPLLVLAAVGVVGGGLFLLLRPGSPTAGDGPANTGSAHGQPAPPRLAPQEQLAQAVSAGLSGLQGLAGQYPQDARVAAAVANTYAAQNNGLEALRWQARAIELDGNSISEQEIKHSAALAVRTPDSAEAAMTLLEGPLGARGVDVLYSLATDSGKGAIKQRSTLSLGRPEVRRNASPAALIALELRAADACEAKRALLPRAARDGDQRTLDQLKLLAQTRSCGPMGLVDCWPCLRQDTALQSAGTAILARLTRNR